MKLLRLTVIILMVVSFCMQTKAQSTDEGLAKHPEIGELERTLPLFFQRNKFIKCCEFLSYA